MVRKLSGKDSILIFITNLWSRCDLFLAFLVCFLYRWWQLWVESCSPEGCVGVLTPRAWACSVGWKQGLCLCPRQDGAMLGSGQGARSAAGLASLWEDRDTDTQRSRSRGRGGRDWSCPVTSKGWNLREEPTPPTPGFQTPVPRTARECMSAVGSARSVVLCRAVLKP